MSITFSRLRHFDRSMGLKGRAGPLKGFARPGSRLQDLASELSIVRNVVLIPQLRLPFRIGFLFAMLLTVKFLGGRKGKRRCIRLLVADALLLHLVYFLFHFLFQIVRHWVWSRLGEKQIHVRDRELPG